MGILKDFKDFAMRGNIIDLATAVVIGAAFGKITTSFVNDVLMPPIGMLLGNVDFKELKIILKEGAEGIEPVSINYGMFIQTVIDFTIIAFAVFLVIQAYQRLQKKKETAPAPPAAQPAPTKDQELLSEIRDLLKKQAGA